MRAMVFGMCVIAVGCAKPSAAEVAPQSAPVDTRNTNFQSGAGTVQNVPKAGARAGAMNDFDQLGKFIELQYNETGKMPTKDEINDYIKRDAVKLHRLISDGTIVLTGTKDHAGLWAYEVDADKAGGIGLTAGRAARLSADDVKAMLAK